MSVSSPKLNINYITTKLDNLITGQLLDINNTSTIAQCDTSLSLYKEIQQLNDEPFSLHKEGPLLENIKLNIYKTGSLFSLAIDLPYDLEELYGVLPDNWSLLFGLLFQYSDDYMDLEQDIINDKPNICKILDKPIVKRIIFNGCDKLQDSVNKFNLNKVVLKYILDRVRSRVC